MLFLAIKQVQEEQMLTAGVIAEYNPFHNGHKYQLDKTRQMGASHIVAVMSGAAVQRGDIAVADKFERAQAALKNGADLVIELPCPYSCASAERFARAGVRLLAGLGEHVVNRLSFGSECGDITKLKAAARLSRELEKSDTVKELTAKGRSYPSAVSKAAAEHDMGGIFEQPNNMLGIEYIKALETAAPWIEPVCVKRKGAEHDSGDIKDNITSASAIRQMIAKGSDYSAYVPDTLTGRAFFLKNADKAVLMKLMTAGEELTRLPDMSAELVQRFLNIRDKHRAEIRSADDLAILFKNKSVTLARVRRMILNITLGIRADDFFDIPYGRILAFNKRGSEILAIAKGKSTLMYDTSLAELEKISSQAARISELEQRAVSLQQLCVKGEPEFISEYTRKITICR